MLQFIYSAIIVGALWILIIKLDKWKVNDLRKKREIEKKAVLNHLLSLDNDQRTN